MAGRQSACARQTTGSVSLKMNGNRILFDEHGRLRSGLRFAFFALTFFFALALSGSLAWLAAFLLAGRSAEATNHLLAGPVGLIVQSVIMLTSATLLGWFCGRIFENLPFRALGWDLRPGWWRDLLRGSALGAASLFLAVIIAWLAGSVRFAANHSSSSANVLRTLLLTLVTFILAAAAEEATFRGYPLQTLLRSLPVWIAIVPSSLAFALVHLANPHAAPGFTLINTFLAGVWLSVAYLRARNLWFPLGAHWAWNWTQGAVLGLPVSGITRLTESSLLRTQEVGPDWLTGGAYGIEGGFACTLALIASTIVLARPSRLTRSQGEISAR